MSRWVETQLLTRAAPTLQNEGMDLKGLQNGFRVFVSAESGATLTDVHLKAYLWDDVYSEWIRSPQLDLDETSVGVRRMVFPDQFVAVSRGRVLYASAASTTSAGTTADIAIQAF